jgi:hypothetical protein
MRFIAKRETPQFFIDEVANLKNWNEVKPDYKKFLNPTKTENIRKYFKYIETSGFIGASNFGKDRAIHTLKVLNLNSPDNFLPEERKKSLAEFREKVKLHSQKTGKDLKSIIKSLLAKENLAFISFLRYVYKDIA